jgi:hypothetical protein
MTEPTPIKGYTDVSEEKRALVNENKILEEKVLRQIEKIKAFGELTPENLRWCAIAFTHIQEGFMALNRAVMRPTRIPLPEDESK